ncbi:unnamed protein product [Rotaria sp. Silwood2]|nr:unnamed protein product [Rotaria sp. Silwood2]CAF2941144.1 unnamed protein product [Rotaria sp. Silwood2]CAF3090096.1 unnamed protein product [Rotaria sp. Silwood2]CAF4061046.1 unnamed protein product [Rotaria sp. Silwood2]CAF4085232.1 unnamed protein product [Rotaria sp. Silwood2]
MASSAATPYSILGADKTSGDFQLRKLYRELIHQFKADRQKPSEKRTISTEKFRKICRAYETLSDHDKRKRYDERQEWISDLAVSKYTLQQLAAEPDLSLELRRRLKNATLRQINAQDSLTGHTPLYCAARACNVEAVHYLIEQGADPDRPQRTGSTSLHVAAFYGHPEMVRCLLECGANYELKNTHGNVAEQESYNNEVRNTFAELKQAPFVQAATNQLDWFKNNIKNIQEHIDTQYHAQQQTLLHCACKKGYFDLARWFIEEHSAEFDIVDINLNSALHLAAYGGHESIVEYLLNQGANSTLINKWGMTAEQEGLVNGTRITDLFRLMREKNMFDMAKDGVDWWFHYHFDDKSSNAVDNQGTSLLYIACRFGQTAVAKWLLDKGANINVQIPVKRSTPLHGAAYNGHLSTVQLLLSRGADVSIRNQFDATALDEATDDEIKKLLQEYRNNLAVDKYIPVRLFGDGKGSGNEPIAEVQLHCDATINDLIKAIPKPHHDKYRWFSIARSPLDFDNETTTLISAVCRARYVSSRFIDLPICLITYNSPRYMNSGYAKRDELPSPNLRAFHGKFKSKCKDASFQIKAKSNETQTYNIKNLLFTFSSGCAEKNISIDLKYTFEPDAEHFQLPQCVCLFQTNYTDKNDKLNDMPTVTINDETNVKLYTWMPNSSYWFSYSNQHNRLPRIGGLHALIRHVEIFSNALCLPPDMFIQAVVGQKFQLCQTPVACQYLNICDYDSQLFPHTAYHGTSINVIRSILMDGLVMPSTVVSNGFRVCPPANHIARGQEAFGIVDFANAIFVSPSIYYCSDPVYAVTFSHDDQRMIAVLECRVKKDAFGAFPSTVSTYKAHPSDNLKAIEWRITCPAAIRITGILFIPVIKSRTEAARLRAKKLDVDPNALG